MGVLWAFQRENTEAKQTLWAYAGNLHKHPKGLISEPWLEAEQNMQFHEASIIDEEPHRFRAVRANVFTSLHSDHHFSSSNIHSSPFFS